MAERFDLLLGGQGYMVAPGSFKRQQAGPAAVGSAAQRVVQRAWTGGLSGMQGQPDAGRFWSSVGLRPLGQGQAAGPGPRERAALAVTGLDPLARRYAVLASTPAGATRPYFVAGTGLWQVDRAGGLNPNNLGGCTQLGGGLGVAATGLAVRDDALFIARGGGNLWRWTIGGAAFTSYALTFYNVAVYGGSVWGLGSVAEPSRLIRVTDLATPAVDSAGWYLDSPIQSATPVGDALYVATRGALWKVRGAPSGAAAFNGTVEPVVFAGGAGFDDAFAFLADYGGELYTWYGGQVMRYRPSGWGGRLEGTGLTAASCRGLTVAGGFLIAAVQDTPQFPNGQLWVYDGQGWWCLARNTGSGTPDYWAPLPTASYVQDADTIAFSFGQDTLHGFQLRAYPTQPGLAPSGELVTALWHGGEPDARKVWLRVGAEFVTPGRASSPGSASFSPCTISLAYTLDGTNFTVAGSATIDTAGTRSLAFDLPPATTGPLLALKYSLSGVVEGAPSLTALWAEYRTVEPAVRKRAWSFEIVAADQTVARDSRLDSRSGRQIAASLWTAWRNAAALPFRDIDYDLDPVERTVRIASLDEQVKAPADAGRWGESRLRVQLVEV